MKKFSAAVLAATMTLAGCVAAPPSTTVPHAPPALPRPAGVTDYTASPDATAAPTEDCDALASLRPPEQMPEPGAMPSGSTMREIQERGRLIVGTDQNNFIFGFLDPFTGEIVGFDIDLSREIAAAIFGDRRDDRVQFVTLSSDERVDAVRSGKVDFVAETMTITCERLKSVAFSTVYYEAVQRVMTFKRSPIDDVSDLAGRRVCAAAGSTSIENVAAKQPAARVVSVPYWTDCLVLLQQGQVDAITTDDTILAGLARQDPSTHLVGKGFNAEPYGIAVNRNEPDLLRFVNGVLERLRTDGTWQRIHTRWLNTGTATPPAPQYQD